jgi:hypothetical protein
MVKRYLHSLQQLRTKHEPKWVSGTQQRLEKQIKNHINACKETIQDSLPQKPLELRNLGETFAKQFSSSAVKASQSLGEFSIQAQLASSVLIVLIALNHVVSPEQVNLSVDGEGHIHIELSEKPMQKRNSTETLITLSKKDVDDYLSKINQYLLALSSATVVPSRLLLGLMKKNKEMGLAGLGYAAAAPLYISDLGTGLGVTALAAIAENMGLEAIFSHGKKTDAGLTLEKVLSPRKKTDQGLKIFLLIPDSLEYLKGKFIGTIPEASTGRKIPAISAQDNINFSQIIEAVRGGALIVFPDSGVLINSLGLVQGLMEGVGVEKIADTLRQEAILDENSAVHNRRQAHSLTMSAFLGLFGKGLVDTPLGPIGAAISNYAEARLDKAVLGLLNRPNSR